MAKRAFHVILYYNVILYSVNSLRGIFDGKGLYCMDNRVILLGVRKVACIVSMVHNNFIPSI